MNQLQAMRVFLRVVDLNSFHLAARQLGISAAAVTRSISTLEAHLNARLLHRSTRSLSLTEAGKRYLEGCRDILTHIDEVESDLMRTTLDPTGSLRIAAPAAFAVTGLPTLLEAYRTIHPRIEFDITTYDARIDMIEGGFDLCFSVDRHLPNSTLVVRQLEAVHEKAVASPVYLQRHGVPATPEALHEHTLLSLSDGSARLSWAFSHAKGDVRFVPRCTLSANNCLMVRAAALAHSGIAVLPAALVQADIDSGTLQAVLEQYQINGDSQKLALLYPTRSYLSTKVRSFIDFAVAQYRPATAAAEASQAASPATTGRQNSAARAAGKALLPSRLAPARAYGGIPASLSV